MSEWRPIDSAPKVEKKPLLLFWPWWSERAIIGWWNGSDWDSGHTLSHGPAQEGPTHWMRLPEPPAMTRILIAALLLIPSIAAASDVTPCRYDTFHECVQALDLPASRDQIERFLEPAVKRQRCVVYPYWWNPRIRRRHPWWICP